MNIEVVYGYKDKQLLLSLNVDESVTVEEAIEQSGIMQHFDDIDLKVNKVGIFGKLTKLSAGLKAGDRVEIYRPLLADPKEVRRRRAAEGKKMSKGGGAADEKPQS
ncbi:MAG: RnfH family protein [Gammaproteobacteria bacterium]|nr:RnfH family protein [Gammaproteobacteria bacterium]